MCLRHMMQAGRLSALAHLRRSQPCSVLLQQGFVTLTHEFEFIYLKKCHVSPPLRVYHVVIRPTRRYQSGNGLDFHRFTTASYSVRNELSVTETFFIRPSADVRPAPAIPHRGAIM